LGHPIPIKNLGDLSFLIEVDIPSVVPGRAWSSIEVAFHIQFSSKPLSAGITRSLVQYELPSDLFEIEARDPRIFNAVLNQSDLDRLKAIKDDIPGARKVSFDAPGVLGNRTTQKSPSREPVPTPVTNENFLRVDPFSLGSQNAGPSNRPSPGIIPLRGREEEPRPEIIRKGTPALEYAANRLRSEGFQVNRIPRTLLEMSESELRGIDGGLYSVLSVIAPELSLSGPGCPSGLSEEQTEMINRHLDVQVWIRVDEEDPHRNIVRLAHFPGSFPMTIGTLFGIFHDISFH